jgi:hypothetical protein
MRSLVTHIAFRLIEPEVKKGWFSAPHVPFQRYLGLYQEGFEIGVVLGYAYRNSILRFAQLFSERGHERELIGFIQKLAQERLNATPNVTNFFELAMFAESSRITGSPV